MGNKNDDSNDSNDNDNSNSSHDWASDCSKINDGRSGAGTGFNKAGGSFRFTKGGSVAPKHYESGWGGGSRGKIKTYKSAKVGGAVSKFATPVGMAFSGYNLYEAYKEDGDHMGNNFKKTVCSEAGSWAGAAGGAAGGAAIGSACCPGIGTVVGGIIGGVIGGIGGGKGGEKIGDKLFDD